jgi:hypothetical protein
MFTATVKASEASPPYDRYDSILEVPSGRNPDQNAWLTLKLRVELNFVDSTHPAKGPRKNDLLVQQKDGKWYAKDGDGWLFPILDWSTSVKEKFKKDFVKKAEKVWNWQFVLLTPRDYQDLDLTSFSGSGWLLRPNVLCLFRLELALSNVHRTINVVNLAKGTKQVVNVDKKKHPNPQNITSPMNAGTWRSDASDYDDNDLFQPYVWNASNKVMHDTIGHEVGHALGQEHILPLKKTAGQYVKDEQPYLIGKNNIAPYADQASLKCETPKEGTNANDCYGKTQVDQFNIMGGGDRIYLINAVSWRERIALHAKGTKPTDWGLTGIMTTPPRKIALGASLVGPTPRF